MKVYSMLDKEGEPPKELKEKWVFTSHGKRSFITLAYVKMDNIYNIWSIVECSTGREMIHDVGKMTKKVFEKISGFIIKYASIDIENAIEVWEKKE